MSIGRTGMASFRGVLTALAIAATAPALAQAAWKQQAPIPTALDLYAVSPVSGTEIWATGSNGILVHTTSLGQSWEVKMLDTNSLAALFFLDAGHGWAAGNGFFHTTDGGQSWNKDNDWGSISELFFIDAQRGWACGNGGVTYRTTNGGLTWSWSSVGPIATLSSIWFVEPQRGWTVNIDGGIYLSTDGGQSWTLQHDAGGYLSTLQFFDAQEGWAIGGDTFLHTTDSGVTWTPRAVPPGTWSHAARFSDPLRGISVGEYGNVTRTIDGGQTWKTVAPIGSGPRLWDVESRSTAQSVYVGETGAIAMTRSAGARWKSLQSGGTGATHALDATDALHAWAANDGGEVLYTANGGGHWGRVAVSGFDNYGRIADVDFIDASLGWAVGRDEFFGGGVGRIVRSTDGGRTWQIQKTVPGAYMEGVEALDAQTVIALGQIPQGVRFILRTANGGQSWEDVSPSQAVFMDTDFVDTSTGWVVGGLIYKTTDGGQTWAQQFTPPDLLYSVSFADPLHGWAVGWGPTLLRTTDGGQTWTPQVVNGPTNVLFAVEALDADVAWIAGANGYVARTTNGGQSWQTESLPGGSGASLEALRFLDATHGWAGGTGIWHRAPAGVADPGDSSSGWEQRMSPASEDVGVGGGR
jgi:photosystem II stability/assembly factor-like uncharacterized protein